MKTTENLLQTEAKYNNDNIYNLFSRRKMRLSECRMMLASTMLSVSIFDEVKSQRFAEIKKQKP